MGNLLDFLKNLGTVRVAIMGVVFAALILLFIFMMTRLTGTSMGLLFSNLDPSDSSQIVAELQQKNIPYEIKEKGSQIFVPKEKVASMRLALASQGLPDGGTIGYEIFDETNALGTTNFMQNISLVRALEGELARTIRSLKSVHAARVHLVLPKRQMFSRKKQTATASVILRMRGSSKLSGERVAAVQHLVASAVPELEPDRVAIVDDKGNLLAKGDKTDTVHADTLIERKISLELRLARELTELLTKSVGPGKVHVRIDADLDFDRVSSTEETYDPDGQVVRSTRTIDENSTSEESENQTVTVQTNLPDGQDNQDGPKASSRESKSDEQVNFEITKKITNFAREIGAIKRLSVAVLVDGLMQKNADGIMEYKPRPPEEMASLTKLVSSAIGYDKERGDTIEVINMRFADQRLDEEKPADSFFGLEKEDLLRMTEVAVLSILAILVILLIVRPLVSRAFETMPATAAGGDQKLLEDGAMITPALSGPDGGDEYDELIDIERIEGRVKASALKKVGEIISNNPEEALSIIRSWMYKDN